MSSLPDDKTVDVRNLLFTVGLLAIVIFCLTVFTEKTVVTRKTPGSTIKSQASEEMPRVPRTTVRIQPLVTKFPPLPDFRSYQGVEERKAAFIDYLTPIIEYQNSKILRDRNRLEEISKDLLNGEMILAGDEEWLRNLAEQYDVEWKENDYAGVVLKLARRVDIIPVSLALVQAAKESSWGRSRYAVQGNNLFGQWCFEEGCGVIPRWRDPEADHEVQRFKSVFDATQSYMHNLNTHPKYLPLREIRQQLRVRHLPVTGIDLADGLLHYSERREVYVHEVKSMILQYRAFQQRRSG